MLCSDCLRIFQAMGDALNSPLQAADVHHQIARTIVDGFGLKGCQFFLLSRDQTGLELIAAHGLSEGFQAGPLPVKGIMREVLLGETVAVPNCATDPRAPQLQAYLAEGINSLLLVPLESRHQLIGAMQLTTADERAFRDDEKAVTRVVASLCASFLLSSMFQKILSDVSETVRTSLVTDDVLKAIVKVIAEDLRAKGCAIRLLNPETNQLELRVSYGLSQEYLEVGPRDAARATAETLEGRCVAVYDAAQYLQYPDQAKREGIASLLSVPLQLYGRAIGTLRIYTHKPYEFSDDETHLMKLVGEQCALLIRNAQLYSSMKDRYENLVTDFHTWFDHFYGPGALNR